MKSVFNQQYEKNCLQILILFLITHDLSIKSLNLPLILASYSFQIMTNSHLANLTLYGNKLHVLLSLYLLKLWFSQRPFIAFLPFSVY